MPVTTPVDEDRLKSRAMAAWFRSGAKDQPTEPEIWACAKGTKHVVLSNIHGVLKVYRIKDDGSLIGLKQIPKEIEAAYQPHKPTRATAPPASAEPLPAD